MAQMTYAQAGCLALRQEMERDANVWALGEDVGPEGGVAGQYLGLQKRFGASRIVDTPISESMIMSAAIGSALLGMRPVAELRYADFALCAADEIINQAAKIRYMLDGQVRVPMVIRQPIGMRWGMAAQHSQSNENIWVGTPGLVVVASATPADNHGLLKAAIRSDDPVVFMEHKELWLETGEVDEAAEPIEIGKASVRRYGCDITLLSWSKTANACLAAADLLAMQGVSAEVIDLRTLWPWDRETVFKSTQKTGRILIAHESPRVGGFGGELLAEIAEVFWGQLKAQPMRIGSPRIPVPYSKPLEDICRISPEIIASTAALLCHPAASSSVVIAPAL
jgi:pyruvate/2-oxoglutarate/acetoin dehydrogenase E1 component